MKLIVVLISRVMNQLNQQLKIVLLSIMKNQRNYQLHYTILPMHILMILLHFMILISSHLLYLNLKLKPRSQRKLLNKSRKKNKKQYIHIIMLILNVILLVHITKHIGLVIENVVLNLLNQSKVKHVLMISWTYYQIIVLFISIILLMMLVCSVIILLQIQLIREQELCHKHWIIVVRRLYSKIHYH